MDHLRRILVSTRNTSVSALCRCNTVLVSVLCRYNTRVRLMSIQHSCPSYIGCNTGVSCVDATQLSVLCRYNTRVRFVSVQHVCPSRQYNTCVRFFACTGVCFLLVQKYLYLSRVSTERVSISNQYTICVHPESVQRLCPSCVSTCVSVLCQYNMRVRLTLVQLACPSCVSTTCESVFCQYKMLCLSNVHLQKNEVKAAQCHIPRLEENKKFKSLFF